MHWSISTNQQLEMVDSPKKASILGQPSNMGRDYDIFIKYK